MKSNVMTQGVAGEIARGNVAVLRLVELTSGLLVDGQEPSMIVGRPGDIQVSLEDEGRTYIVPLPSACPKIYVCLNETGGTTAMLADEY